MADGAVVFEVQLDSAGLSSALSGLGKSIGKSAAIAAAGAAIGKGLTSAINTGMSFETVMSKVKALSGATEFQMMGLTEAAKELGATTAFSASEAGEAFTFMAQAGWSTGEMIKGIKPILDLAAADGLDLATTSDIVTDALTAFGLSASDAGTFADTLATAAAASNTNVAMMGETFKYVGPVAGALGYDIKDISVAVGLMANAGIKGSQAGTALRATLTRMVKPTKQSQEAMDKLGLSLTNADGTMKPFSQVMGEMRKSFAGLTEAEKANYAALLAGQEGMSGLLAIVNASGEEFNNLADAIDKSGGSAERMAKIMQDNLAGDIEEFKGAAETLAIEFYETFSDSLRTAVQTGTSIVQKLTAGVKEGDLSTALSGIFEKDVPQIASSIGTMIGKAFGKLPQFLEDTGDVTNSLVTGLMDGTKALAQGIATGIGDNLPTLLPDIASKIVSGLGTAFESLPEFVTLATQLVTGLKTALLGSDTEDVSAAISEQMQGLGESLMGSLTSAISNLPDLAVSVGEIIGAISKVIGEGLAGLVEGVEGNDVAKSLGELAGAIVSGIVAALPGIADGFASIGSALMSGLESALTDTEGEDGALTTFAKNLLKSVAEALKLDEEESKTLNTAFSEIISSLTAFEENAQSFSFDALTTLNDALSALSTWCTENKAAVVAALGALGIALLAINAPLVLGAAAVTLVIANWDSLKSAAKALAESLSEWLGKAGKAIEDFINKASILFTGDFSGENPFGPDSFFGKLWQYQADQQEAAFSWSDIGALLIPSAGAEGAELPSEAKKGLEQYASSLSQEAQTALLEAFQNGEISADVLEALVFGSSDGAIPEDQLLAMVDQITTMGTQLKQELIASITGASEEGAAAGAAEGAGEEADGLMALGLSLAKAVADGITSGAGQVKTSLNDAVTNAKNGVQIQPFVTLGLQIAQGVARGIKQGSGAIALAMIAAIKGALAAGLEAADIHSPSRLFRDAIGRMLPAGAAEGVEMEAWQLRAAARQMVLDSVPDMRGFSRMVARDVNFGWMDGRIAKRAAMAGYQPIQEVNFNVPVQTPDEFAQTVELFMSYGLEADY